MKIKHAWILITFVGACLGVASCATPQERITQQEDRLAAAGFTVLPANNPTREAELHQLPPNKFIQRPRGDRMEYVYADPVACNCLYIGTQANYGAYKQQMFQQHLADEQQMTAMLYQNSWDWNRWNWGPWGPGWW